MSSAAARTVVTDDRRAPPLAAVEWGYLVGKRRALCELPPEKQQQIVEAYKDTDWAAENDVEFLGFTTDYQTAVDKAASTEGGFWVKLPVGFWLPEQAGRYTAQGHPNSPASEFYSQTSPSLEVVDRSLIMELAGTINRSCKAAGVS